MRRHWVAAVALALMTATNAWADQSVAAPSVDTPERRQAAGGQAAAGDSVADCRALLTSQKLASQDCKSWVSLLVLRIAIQGGGRNQGPPVMLGLPPRQ